MCIQCVVQAIYIAEFAPGWHVVKATKTADNWTAGQYALVRVNDPDYILDVDLANPMYGSSEVLNTFYDNIMGFPIAGHSLVEALKQVKYPFAVRRLWVKHNAFFFDEQLYIYLCWVVKNATATTS